MFTGSVQRKFPRARYPHARRQAVNAANKAGLNALARITQRGQYSEESKNKKKILRQTKNKGNQYDELSEYQ